MLVPIVCSFTPDFLTILAENFRDNQISWNVVFGHAQLRLALWRNITYVLTSPGIFQPLICDKRKSVTATSSGYSGIHTVKRAKPEFEPYLTIIDAFDDTSVSVPSTYTELHDVDTCTRQ